MYDNLLLKNSIIAMQSGLAALGLTGANAPQVVQRDQPTNQGTNTKNTVFLTIIGDHRYGWKKTEDVWDQDSETMIHTETQFYETMIQVNALAIQNPALTTDNTLTAKDLVNYAAAAMQSDVTLEYLRSQGLGILRITDIRNTPFTDDRDRFEYDPSFDFTLEHEQVIISTSPVATSIEVNINRV